MEDAMFLNVPLNTKKQYICGVDDTGCKIYVPVDTEDFSILNRKKELLQDWLDNQFPVSPEAA